MDFTNVIQPGGQTTYPLPPNCESNVNRAVLNVISVAARSLIEQAIPDGIRLVECETRMDTIPSTRDNLWVEARLVAVKGNEFNYDINLYQGGAKVGSGAHRLVAAKIAC